MANDTSLQSQINTILELYSDGQITEALNYTESLIIKYPDESLLFNISGVCYKAIDQLQNAIQSFEKAVIIKPNFTDAYYNLGLTFQELNMLEAAVKSYEKAIEIEPKYAIAHNNLGIVFKELGQIYESINSYQKAIVFQPEFPEAYNNLGNALKENDHLDKAISSYEKAISLAPNFSDAYNNIGIILSNQGKADEAIKFYKKALDIEPNYSEFHNNLGNALKENGQLDEAIMSYKAAITNQFDYADAHYNLGLILHRLQRLDGAVSSYKTAITFEPDYADAHYNLGILFHDTGRLEMAIESIKTAIKINPENADTHKYLGNTFQSNGQIDEAIKCYEKALSINPFHADAHRNLSTIKNYSHGDDQITLMEEILQDGSLTKSDQIYLDFALAKANEDLEKKDDLFKVLNEGNRLRQEELNYSLKKDLDEHSNLKKLININPSNSNKSVSFKPSKIQPIFIVGMPRSGTSLVEQIISSHQKTYGAGELSTLNNLIMPIVNDCIIQDKKVSDDDYLKIRNEYLGHISRLNAPETIITDKMPTNFRYIGFILKAFPEAKIINLNRDSRAVCWSIYKSFFPGKGLGWAFNMEDLAGYYNSYSDLMSFWHQLFPKKIYDICYEDLTINQEPETRKLLEYCELDWDDNCLNFHTNKRAVKTTSSLQVRKKMYQGSSEVWKKYESYLKPLISNLKY
jgi:tetratricopeptide (TPR) repeat protein